MAAVAVKGPKSIREILHGVEVRDPFRWLEQGGRPEVRAWTARQNRILRRSLDAIPSREPLAQRLRCLFSVGSLESPEIIGHGPAARYFYARRAGQQNQPVLVWRQGLQGVDHVLVDLNQLSAEGCYALDWWYPSQDGRLMAYGVSQHGDEQSTLHVREVDSGRDRRDVIPWTRGCSLAWLPSGRGFYYTRHQALEPRSGQQPLRFRVYLHRLGTDSVRDRLVFGEGLGPSKWPELRLSPDGKHLVIEVSEGSVRSDLFLIDARDRVPRPTSLVTGRSALFRVADVLEDKIYVVSNEDAPLGRLFHIDMDRPARPHWKEIIPEGKDTLESARVIGGKLVAVFLKDACSRVRVYSRRGKWERDVRLPGLGTVTGLHGHHRTRDFFFAFTSFLTPTMILRHHLGTARTSAWQKVESSLNCKRISVRQVRYPSKDGTLIPMFLIGRKSGFAGKRPVLLSGYGGFNISITPEYAAWVGPFIEQGGLYAVANLRGGGEFGESWHRAGMLESKRNVFDDFIAAAEYLLRQRITSRARLAITGRSNGGLLVAATITQRPELFRAAVCGVPITDMVRYHRFGVAEFWVPEYGCAEDPEQFKVLYAYSPYHQVKRGVAYPATLVFTGDSDARVDPLHARKFAARLQAAQGGPHPILLRSESEAGHGAGKSIYKLIEQHADELAFLFRELGMKLG
jgi:prolyl oligopeptidase